MEKPDAMQTLVVKVLSTHKAAVQRMARDDSEPMAAFVRRLIREEAQRRGLWPVAAERPTEREEVTHA